MRCFTAHDNPAAAGWGDDVEVIQSALEHQQLVLPPGVLTELLSEPALPQMVRSLLTALPQLNIEPGYWERAGLLRASILKQRRKARIADALIAQSCLDQSEPLVTRDKDFHHFAKSASLALLSRVSSVAAAARWIINP